jgi:hypothetical protein
MVLDPKPEGQANTNAKPGVERAGGQALARGANEKKKPKAIYLYLPIDLFLWICFEVFMFHSLTNSVVFF